jgi:Flp pilus assembly protein TadG
MRRGTRDRGAATIETAFVVPILFCVIFALIELAGALATYSATAGAVRAGGRVASVVGADPMADSAILTRVAQEAGTGEGKVEVVVIWHASGPGTTVPAGCVPASPYTMNTSSVGVTDGGTDAVGACNVYILPSSPGGAFAMANGSATFPASYYFACQGSTDPQAAQKLDCKWPAKNRRALTRPRSSTSTPKSTDFVGVYVRVKHSYYTTMFGSTLTITDQSISLIEPQGYDVS